MNTIDYVSSIETASENATCLLDPAVVQIKQLKGWSAFVWITWGNRPYARNARLPGRIAAHFLMMFIAAAAVAFFYYFPFKILGAMVFLGLNIAAMFSPIREANESYFMGWFNFLLGGAGFVLHWDLGLTLFSFSLSSYLWGGYCLGGGLAVIRRYWNAIIWKILDRITLRYYLQNGLDFDEHALPLRDYRDAYHRLCQTVCALLEAHRLSGITSSDEKRLHQWFENHSISGLEKALNLLNGNREVNDEK